MSKYHNHDLERFDQQFAETTEERNERLAKRRKEKAAIDPDSYEGPPDDAPYVPSWCYAKGPKMCPCGHHEGYHADDGSCVLWRR